MQRKNARVVATTNVVLERGVDSVARRLDPGESLYSFDEFRIQNDIGPFGARSAYFLHEITIHIQCVY